MRQGALLGVRERKFGPDEGKKDEQVRRKQEVGMSRSLARGMLQHLLLSCWKGQTHVQGGGNGSSHPPLLGHGLLQVSHLGWHPARLQVKLQLLQSHVEIPTQSHAKQSSSEITTPNRSHHGPARPR